VATDGITDKFGVGSTANIGIFFEGDTSSDWGVPITVGINKVANSGTITGNASNTGTAITVMNGDTTIINNAGGLIIGDTAIDASANTGAMSITNRGTISGGITLKDNTIPTTLDIGNTALTVNSGYISSLTVGVNSSNDLTIPILTP